MSIAPAIIEYFNTKLTFINQYELNLTVSSFILCKYEQQMSENVIDLPYFITSGNFFGMFFSFSGDLLVFNMLKSPLYSSVRKIIFQNLSKCRDFVSSQLEMGWKSINLGNCAAFCISKKSIFLYLHFHKCQLFRCMHMVWHGIISHGKIVWNGRTYGEKNNCLWCGNFWMADDSAS